MPHNADRQKQRYLDTRILGLGHTKEWGGHFPAAPARAKQFTDRSDSDSFWDAD